MLFPISLLLSLFLFCSSTTESTRVIPEAFAQSLSSQAIFTTATDSLIFRELSKRLTHQCEEVAQEKIYLQTDRTLYAPGKTVWFAAYLINSSNHLPSRKSQILYVELQDARGAILQKKQLLALDGKAVGEFNLSNNLAGGLYKIRAYSSWSQNFGPGFEREITVQKVVLPKLNLKLEFEKKAHGAGDEVVAIFNAETLENQPLRHSKINFTANYRGISFRNGECQTDAFGRAFIKFSLPDDLEKPDALLNITLQHDGQTEAISRAIPIVLNKIDLQFLPEGGDAISGLECRMAFKATNEFGKPADVAGVILNEAGQEVATFESTHNGMGSFNFLPKDEQYRARIDRPVGVGNVPQIVHLLKILPQGVAMQVKLPAEKNQKYVDILLTSTENRKVLLVGTQYDKLFFFKELDVSPKTKIIKVPIGDLPIGIANFTILDAQKNELAERLVFLHRDRTLDAQCQFDKEKYLPREQVKMKLKVRDHCGNPIAGNFSLSVVDENQLSFADDKQGHLLASILLAQELKGEIFEPNFYFDTTEAKSYAALDLLMLTQGWRQFFWKEVAENQSFVPKYLSERATVAGTVLDENGKPKSMVTVSLHPHGPSQKTDKNGKFQFENFDISLQQYLEIGNKRRLPLHDYRSDWQIWDGANFSAGLTTMATEPTKDGKTYLSGKVIDYNTHEALIGVTVYISKGDTIVKGGVTNLKGEFRFELAPGEYRVRLRYTGYNDLMVDVINLNAGTKTQISFYALQQAALEETALVYGYNVLPFSTQKQVHDISSQSTTLTAEQIIHLPTRSLNANVATTAGSTSKDQISLKGSRSNATVYYIDGVRVSGRAAGEHRVVDDKVHSENSLRNFSRARAFYMPKYEEISNATTRDDFRTTIFWEPNIRTDHNGHAEVTFFTSDAITNFRATLEGFGTAGQALHAVQKFFVQKPFSVGAKTPDFVISGDVLHLPLTFSNKTNSPVSGQIFVAVPTHFKLKNTLPSQITLAENETKVVEVIFEIGTQTIENQKVRFGFAAPEAFEDFVETQIKTLDRGFPYRIVAAGNKDQNIFNFYLEQAVEGSVQAKLTAYPNQIQDILKTAERMLRQPNGCFEQVSSTNYPNLLVLDLLRTTGTTRPEIEEKAQKFLLQGYEKLKGYECKTGGFDWYGRDPGHEGLTAYGILQFVDMKNVFDIDNELINRSLQWLEQRRDGQGGWKKRSDCLHSWDNEILGAYMAWAVAEAGFARKFQPEINAAAIAALQSDDPYQLALLTNAFLKIGDARSLQFYEKLLEKRQPDGTWMGKKNSITRSTGNCLKIETTALAGLAMLAFGNESALQAALKFVTGAKNEYGYGSTQSTVLALKFLVAVAQKNNHEIHNGNLVVRVNGNEIGNFIFSNTDFKVLEMNNLGIYFTQGNNQVEVFFEGDSGAIPFDIELKYASRQPRNAPNCPLHFSTKLDRTTATIGETVRLTTLLENTTNTALASPMVVLGIPAGLSLQHWQLKKMMDEKRCDFYELWDGFAVFHYDKLEAGASRELTFDLRAELAGEYESPASQAFLYYDNEQRVWDKPASLHIRE